MNVILTILLAVQILTALVMIGLILIQHGKGADMGAAFGSGGSGSLFGASGSANFLSRTTAVLASIFFVCTLALAYFGSATAARLRQRARAHRDGAGSGRIGPGRADSRVGRACAGRQRSRAGRRRARACDARFGRGADPDASRAFSRRGLRGNASVSE